MLEEIIEGLEWILEDDRLGLGVHWDVNSEPKDEYEQAGYNIQRAIDYLKGGNKWGVLIVLTA